jgi:hypothetical protein
VRTILTSIKNGFGLFYFLVFYLTAHYALFPGLLSAQESGPAIKILALHAHRYQDQQVDRIRCEVFGEIKNPSNRPLKSLTVTIEFLDEKGKLIATEDANLALRIVGTGNARGEARPVRPQEIGNFNQDTVNCPDNWLEGRIRYKVKNIEWE